MSLALKMRGVYNILLPRAQEKMTVPHLVGYRSTAFGCSRLELWKLRGPHSGAVLALAKVEANKKSEQNWGHTMDPVEFWVLNRGRLEVVPYVKTQYSSRLRQTSTTLKMLIHLDISMGYITTLFQFHSFILLNVMET
jgi:hypothetical protein